MDQLMGAARAPVARRRPCRAARGAAAALLLALAGCATDEVNAPPVAVAGFDQRVEMPADGPAEAFLDATASFDPDGDPIEVRWAVLRAPSGLTLLGDARTAEVPRLELTVPGLYIFELVVTDGVDTSAPDHVNVLVARPAQSP